MSSSGDPDRIIYTTNPQELDRFEWVESRVWCNFKTFLIGDFNGDNISDWLCHKQDSGKTWVALTGEVTDNPSSNSW